MAHCFLTDFFVEVPLPIVTHHTRKIYSSPTDSNQGNTLWGALHPGGMLRYFPEFRLKVKMYRSIDARGIRGTISEDK
jgi:hypothetical protein